MDKKLPFTILFLGLFLTASAQENPVPLQRNTLFVEIAGKGGFYSLNYDRILLDKGSWRVAGRVGGMFYRSKLNVVGTNYQTMVTLPFELSYLRGKRNHMVELGIGVTPVYRKYDKVEQYSPNILVFQPTPSISYRYQKREGGMFYKATVISMFTYVKKYNSTRNFYLHPWLGLSIGYTLKN